MRVAARKNSDRTRDNQCCFLFHRTTDADVRAIFRVGRASMFAALPTCEESNHVEDLKRKMAGMAKATH
jgi:hypothetical protein